MPRKLKTYQTSQGFFDLAIAAPSMKAALEAWGAGLNLFREGFAKESDDSHVIAATMAKPGIVLRRPVGSNKPFREHSELPTAASLDAHVREPKPPRTKARPSQERKVDEKAERAAAAAFEKEERKREQRRQREETAAEKLRARRKVAIEKAETALAEARRDHDERSALIEKAREAAVHRAEEEDKRWQKVKTRLEASLRKSGRLNVP
jgi:colicin import membrane protein